ncbi:hypothetical protein [Salibacterium aidingense]|uniref:hypothetical protein n=1 Tax=Salibacterium aidingense TaxID=384933 RepID=UPI003BDDAE48
MKHLEYLEAHLETIEAEIDRLLAPYSYHEREQELESRLLPGCLGRKQNKRDEAFRTLSPCAKETRPKKGYDEKQPFLSGNRRGLSSRCYKGGGRMEAQGFKVTIEQDKGLA